VYSFIEEADYNTINHDFQIQSLVTGQYDSYKLEIGKNSNTETAFQAVLKSDGIDITLESSKKMEEKITQIDIQFEDGSTLTWNIHPLGKIEFFSKNTFMNIQLKNEFSDHYNVFTDIINGDKSRFLTFSKISQAWQLLEQLTNMKTQPIIY
jgi:glucose-6-phosphate 1-dehydrogenase